LQGDPAAACICCVGPVPFLILWWSSSIMMNSIYVDFKLSRQRVWCSELSSGLYCRVNWWRQHIPLKTSVDNYFTWQYIPEDKSELHTRRRENLKSPTVSKMSYTSYKSVLPYRAESTCIIWSQVELLPANMANGHLSVFCS
jgi:hypothetical protein